MKVTNFKQYEKGTLQGFFELTLDSGMNIRGMTYHVKEDGKRWVGFPTKPYDSDGETKYQNIVYIPDDARWQQFQKLCLEALDVVLNEEQVIGDVPF